MPREASRERQSELQKSRVIELCVCALCVLFEIASIANIHTANEGTWYWYARLLLDGHRLYSELHLALQPLFVEETAVFLALLGKSWLASKVPAILHTVLFVAGLYLVVRRAPALAGFERAVLIACAFFSSTGFVAYRFDDYHVLADCFQVYCLLLLLKFEEATSDRARFTLAAGTGVMAGLSIATRLNDGAALLAGTVVSIFFLERTRRMLWSLIACAAAGVTIVLAVSVTGDSLRDWASRSIVSAAATKGGAGSVLSHPMHLPRSAVDLMRDWQTSQFTLYLLVCGVIYAFAIAPLLRREKKARPWLAAAGAAMIVLPSHRYWYRGDFQGQKLAIDLGAVGVFLIFGLALLVVSRAIWNLAARRPIRGWSGREMLLLIPAGQLASGAMSSGGSHIGLYGPVGITLLLFPVVFRSALPSIPVRGVIIAMAGVLAAHFAIFKWNTPYLWHTYRAERLFVDRQWYRHPDYGPMVVEVHLLQMIEPICAAVHKSQSHELLSLPYSYPNYFCSVEPWHGYVQTFFDTSSSATIFQLIGELQKAPPMWIVYQRQLQVLSLHEMVYNHGQPLPQRFLDEMIENKLSSGAWHAEYTSSFGTFPGLADEWILIRTR